MDISEYLSKQLEEKRQKRQKRQQAKQNDPNLGPLNLDYSNSLSVRQDKEEHNDTKSEESPAVPQSQESLILDSVDQEKLTDSLRLLDENEEGALKEEQLRRLQIHVRHEKKDRIYKEYLDQENLVEAFIKISDIAEQKTEKLCLQIRRFFKEILQTWATSYDEQFPEHILLETKRDIVKLMYKLRSNKLSQETVVSLLTIVYYIQTEKIVKANEAYLKLSIGNVAWPIGVRDVGIHARAADAKIAGEDKKQLSNIMKSEATRRWLIAVKRIVNYCGQLHEKQT